MPPIAFTLVFAAALVVALLARMALSTRQMRHVAAHRDAVPAPFAAVVPLAAHQRAADYTLAKGRVGLLETAFAVALLLGWTLLGGLDALNAVLREAVEPRWGAMAYQLSLLQCLLEVVGEKDKTFRIGVFSSLTLLSNILSPMAGVWLYAALGSDQRAIILTMGISTVLRFVGAGLFLLRWRALRGTPDIGRKTASPVEAVQATGALGTGASASDPAATE